MSLLEHLDEVQGKAREHIERDREMLLLSRELVTIDTKVPLEGGFESIGPPAPDEARLIAWLDAGGALDLVDHRVQCGVGVVGRALVAQPCV